jgi:hypothetical protein
MLPFCFFSDSFTNFWALKQRQQHFTRGMGHHSSTLVISLDLWFMFTLNHFLYKMVDRGLVTGLMESAAGEWMMIVSLVFGGCCSYVPIIT